jgi:hypothetical protein
MHERDSFQSNESGCVWLAGLILQVACTVEGALGRGCFIPLRGLSKRGSGKRVSSDRETDMTSSDWMVQSRVPVRDKEHQTEMSHTSLVSGSSSRNKARRVRENRSGESRHALHR